MPLSFLGGIMEKTCIKCNFKGKENLFKSNICKECLKKYRKQWNELNKDKRRVYREQNREKAKEYAKNYREKNRESICIDKKIYREKNKEKITKHKKEYWENNKERFREKRKEYYQDNKEFINKSKLMKIFGITVDEYYRMFDSQNGKCAVCGRPQSECSRAFAVDHIHMTGYENLSSTEKKKYVRGLLCISCNTALGKLQDNPEILQKGIEYLLYYNRKENNMTNKYFFGLDLSLNSTGIAVFTTDDMQFVETSTIAINKSSQNMRETKNKLKYIGEELIKYKKEYKPEFIVMEQGFMRYVNSTAQLMRVAGVTEYIFADIPQYCVPSSTIKKKLTGFGNSEKEKVADAILKIYPKIRFTTTDESDACGLCIYWGIQEGWMKNNATLNI